jgi:hypothetical protein
VDEEALERLRESSGLRLDGEGRFWHQGTPVEHARTVEVLHRGLHRAPDGRWATRIGREWAYVAVDSAAFFVRRIEPEPGRPLLRAWLVDGRELLVEPAALMHGEGDALALRLPEGEKARLLRAAQASLAPLLHEREGLLFLEVNGARAALVPA